MAIQTHWRWLKDLQVKKLISVEIDNEHVRLKVNHERKADVRSFPTVDEKFLIKLLIHLQGAGQRLSAHGFPFTQAIKKSEAFLLPAFNTMI
ncbi:MULTISPECIES: hypothetical protein [Pantoea]|uniref:hypothetical protein n=1 Tax=Pantoea TaxID=53335 RepID=UPI000EE37ED8|nr:MULTISPECIES: hypothetical protein [Pantoea]MDU5475211.1 hypothetical protein [Pantoea sp.]HAB73488.1 hypothetical protein [Pantoea sp.]